MGPGAFDNLRRQACLHLPLEMRRERAAKSDTNPGSEALELNTYRLCLQAANPLGIEDHLLNVQSLVDDLKRYEEVSNWVEGDI